MNPYGQQQGMGAPMGGGPMGAMGGAMGQMGLSGGGPGPNKRNPIMMLLIPWGTYVVLQIVASVMASIVPILGSLLGLVAWIGYIGLLGFLLNKMLSELKVVTNDQEIASWMMWVPGLNNVMAMIKVYPLMVRAKQMRGVQTPARPNWMYLVIPTFAFSADLNDLC